MLAESRKIEIGSEAIQLSWRLYMMLGGVALVILIMIGYGYYASLKMVTRYAPLVDATMEIKLSLTTAHLWFEEIISGDDSEDINEKVYAHIDEAAWYADAILNGGENEEGKFVPLKNEELRQTLLQVQQDIDEFRRVTGERYAARDTAGVGTTLDQQFDAIYTGVTEEADSVETQLHHIIASETNTFKTAEVALIIITVLAFAFAGGMLYRFDVRRAQNIGQLQSMTDDLEQMAIREQESRNALEESVSELMGFVQRVAEGDLSSRLELSQTEDSFEDIYLLGQNLNSMVENLSIMAQQVRETVNAVTSAASEIQAATAQQTASATEQNATVTQTVATVEEVRQTVQQTAERARSVADNAGKSVEISIEGQRAVESTIEGMNIIRERVESIAENILMLSEKTQQIGEIIDTVNTLADQSKLLALNASIEAARAGEEGKGFAVVAMEVRQLAEQSRDATSRVQGILNEIQQATNSAVMVTEEGSKGAEQGMSLVEQAGLAIRDLSSTIEEAAQAAGQIAASTHQQTNGMDQLAIAMSQIEQATAQATATTQQTETSVRDLMDMAHQLEAAAARYQL